MIQKLTAKEEDIMSIIWKLKKAFVKEIMPELKESLHYNTVSTIVRNLEEKKFVAHKAFGKTHQYYPLVSKEEYSKLIMQLNSQRFFGGSYKNMVSFFAENEKISKKELEEILELIKK
jgi:predicted transcriptional regulator